MIATDGGEIDREKSASVRLPLPPRGILLLVPVTGMPSVPGATPVSMLTVKMDVPDPVTVGGLKLPEGQVIPAGKVLQARVTTPLNPLTLETATVRDAVVEPLFTVTDATLTVKS